MNLTSWDIQSKHIYTTDGVSPPIYSGECRYGGGEAYILVTVDDVYETKEISRDNNGT